MNDQQPLSEETIKALLELGEVLRDIHIPPCKEKDIIETDKLTSSNAYAQNRANYNIGSKITRRYQKGEV